MNNEESILKEYSEAKPVFKDLLKQTERLLNNLLKARGINVHSVSGRVKKKDSLKKKIKSKIKYSALKDITDVIGLRVITHFDDEVDDVAKLINEEFKLDLPNCIDKRDKSFDRFGYSSLHYVVTIADHRKDFPENVRFKEIKFEIQIRSILQHAWAEIEHDLGYKSNAVVPDISKRDFSRISALLETADIEFVRLKKTLVTYEIKVKYDIANRPDHVEINDISLLVYFQNDSLITDIDKEITKRMGLKYQFTLHLDYNDVKKLKSLGIITIKQLQDVLVSNRATITEFAYLFNKNSDPLYINSAEDLGESSFSSGIALFYLSYLLAIQSEDDNIILNFLMDFFPFMDSKEFLNYLKAAYIESRDLDKA